MKQTSLRCYRNAGSFYMHPNCSARYFVFIIAATTASIKRLVVIEKEF